MDIKSSNGKNDKFTGTVTIMSLDEKSQREYKYKDNKLESKKNSRMADFGNQDLPEVTVTAYVNHGGTWLTVNLMFGPANSMPSAIYYMVDPCNDCQGAAFVDLEWDPALVQAMIDWVRQKLLEEASHSLNPAEMDILRTMSTGDIVKFYNNYLLATKLTDRMWPGTLGRNDAVNHPNAFKHALFAALHAQDFGSNIALRLTNAHEIGQGSGCDTQMDLLNNAIGINLGASFTGNSNALIMSIYNMAKYGELWTVGGGCVHKVPF